jgi:Obg family GTPase CgtA
MRFYDTVTVRVQSWKWGDGCVSARREAGIPYGWPAGWNGGKWGSVIFEANQHLTTLADFRPGKLYKADDGMPGRTKEQDGKDAQDLILEVPVGTLIIDKASQVIIWQVTEHGEQYLVAKGGRHGIGNMHFKSSTRQYPNFALKGEPGVLCEIKLELQLIADIALIWTPSVGKSSIINTLAHTKAKVADYPFTTLVPNLWTIQAYGKHYHVIDIPWLIHGAHTGKWLWNAFLRHILKAHVLAVVLDINRFDTGIREFGQTMDELMMYIQERYNQTPEFGIPITNIKISIVIDQLIRLHIVIDTPQGPQLLLEKIIHIIVNKIDLVTDTEIVTEYQHQLLDYVTAYLQHYSTHHVDPLSVVPHIHTVTTMLPWWCDVLTKIWSDIIWDQHTTQHQYIDRIIWTYHPDIPIQIHEITDQELPILIWQWYLQAWQAPHIKVRSITHPEICRLAMIIPRSNQQAEERFWKQCMRQKLINRWTRAWVMTWDVFKVVSLYPGTDDLYITYE